MQGSGFGGHLPADGPCGFDCCGGECPWCSVFESKTGSHRTHGVSLRMWWERLNPLESQTPPSRKFGAPLSVWVGREPAFLTRPRQRAGARWALLQSRFTSRGEAARSHGAGLTFVIQIEATPRLNDFP